MNVLEFWQAVLRQDAAAIRAYFHPDAEICWYCSNERFTTEEFIRANCEYPGSWLGEVERAEALGELLITAVHVWPQDGTASFHVTSFIRLQQDRIIALDEYWADDAAAPLWRQQMQIGRPLR